MRGKVYMNGEPKSPKGSFERAAEDIWEELLQPDGALEGTNILRQFTEYHQRLPGQAHCRFCGKKMKDWKGSDICQGDKKS